MKTKQIRAILAAITCSAGISQAAVIPYSSDSSTLHLWHLDEAAHPLGDSAGSLVLYNWGGAGTLEVDSVAGLNTAYESSKTVPSVMMSIGDISWTNELMGADGAFTWEMALRPDDAANSAGSVQMLMHHQINEIIVFLRLFDQGFPQRDHLIF